MLVAVQNKDLVERSTSGSIVSHSDNQSIFEFKVTRTPFHNVSFNFSTWLLQPRLYKLVLEVAIPLQ